MVREILKIYTDNGLGNNNPTFKGIELTEYNAKFSRMGFPELTATLMWYSCLDDEWSGKEYIVLRGERFYINDTPHSEKSNTDARWKHEIEFTSEFARILGNTLFVDAVPSYAETYDKPCTNNTKFTFFGTISEFCDRLNCAFIYAGIADSVLKTKTSLTPMDVPVGDGYCVMLDPYGAGDIYDPDKSYEFSFEDKFLWEAITEGYNITEIPFERRGKAITFGALPKVVDHKFEYGHDNELLSVKHRNAKAKVVNRITMVGSSENIPYYYPNETEYGHISIAPKAGNKVLTASHIQIANMTQLLSRLNADDFAILQKYGNETDDSASEYITIGDYAMYSYDEDEDSEYVHYIPNTFKEYRFENNEWKVFKWPFRVNIEVLKSGYVKLNNIYADVWFTNSPQPSEPMPVWSVTVDDIHTADGQLINNNIRSNDDGTAELGHLDAGKYVLQISVDVKNKITDNLNASVLLVRLQPVTVGVYKTDTYDTAYRKEWYYWAVGDKKYDGVGALGVKITLNPTDDMIGDGFGWVASGRMPFQDHLIPPKYRETLGAERFYNALNNTYTDPDTNTPYVFPNPYVKGAPSEHIFRDDDRKPTIEGVTNASGQLMGVIADIAYDVNDNDVLKPDSDGDSDKNDSLKYEHSFFYIKLNIFDGPYGFNLFEHASQTDPMTIQMRDGSCNGCKFKIQALEYEDETGLKSYKNPVQTTGANGNIVSGGYEDKVKEDWQEWQQNTQTHSIWICVQKDAETLGKIMPNQSNKFLPKIGDKFNIINIVMPLSYWYAAEKRLEEDGIRNMADNNDEKFTFDIQASRIFFADNPQVLAQLDEYSVIKVRYNGKTYEQYVNQLSIDCKDSEALPNIGIDLTDTLAVGQSFIEQVAERASSLIANPYTMGGATGGNGGGLTTRLADQRYLKKTEADRSVGKVASDVGFEVGDFVSGSSGGIFFRDPETGQTYIEVDKIKARMKAIFAELEVAKEQSIGGKFDITPGGGIDISFVEELTDSYRCYFKAKDEDKGANCRFVVGDQARCQESNIANGTTQDASNRYYWRLVTAVNNDESYIELSKSDCDMGSDAPMSGDTIVQLGNRDNPERQSAIVLSTVDVYAPCVTLYNGIDHYSLDGKAVVEYGVDKTKTPPEPFFNCYGRFFFGPKGGNSYLKFEPSVGKLIFSGELINITTLNGKDIDQYIKDVVPSVTQEDIEDYVNAIVDPQIEGLQNQIDGVIETWFGDGAPSLDRSEYPMNQWGDTSNDAHSGDLYYDNLTGYAYRFSKDGNTWKWVTITDEAITKALAAAQKAQDTADGKRKTFVTQPTVNDEYQVGDLWVNATYAPDYNDDILRCITAKAKGEPFSISHWTLASKYTDDSALNQFISDYEDTIGDIKGQLDGKAETWYQAIDPSTDWDTPELKALHVGDLWYNTTNGTTWYWDGSHWQQQDVPKSVFDAIDGKADIFVTAPTSGYHKNDLWFLEADYTLSDGAHKAGTLAVALRDMGATFDLNDWAKKDRYTDDTKAEQAIEEIGGYQYLRDAIANGATTIHGGLIMSSLIKLGTWNRDDLEAPKQDKIWAGMNGLWHHEKTIASWWGGDMVDKYYNDSVTARPNPLADGYAQALIRMDGSGYLAGGNIRWDEYGNLILGNGISLGGGSTTIGDVANLFPTVESLTLLFNKFSQALIPIKLVGNTPTPTTWADIASDLSNLYAVESQKGFYSKDFISAKGLNPDGSAGSGATQLRMLDDVLINDNALSAGQALVYNGTSWVNQTINQGLDTTQLAQYLTDNGYATEQWVESKGYITTITKSMVEDVLTGNIASHTHSQYLTNAALTPYLTKDEAQRLYLTEATWIDLKDIPNWIGDNKPTYDFWEIEEKPTTLEGYGITDAYTKDDADGRYVKKSGDTMTGTLKITNGYLNINGSFITGLDDGGFQFMPKGSLRAEMNSVSFYPTTAMRLGMSEHRWHTVYATNVDVSTKVMFGDCEITWDADKGMLKFSKGIYSEGSVSARGANSDAGGGSVGIDEAQLADYLTEHGYATLSWVNKQGFLKSVAWGDVSGKPSWIGASKPSYAFNEITGKPTTLAGYGITDAKIAGGVITLGGNSITPLTSHQSLSGYATQSWVQSQGYLTSLPSHTHSYLPLSGGSLSGVLHLLANQYTDSANTGSLNLNNSDIYGVNSIKFADLSDSAGEGLQWYRDATHIDSFWVNNGVMYFTPNRAWGTTGSNNVVLHSGNISSYAVTSLAGYATTSWVQNQGYLTGHQSLANYVTLNTAQTISAKKTFSAGLAIGGATERTDLPYFLGIDAYADGGSVRCLTASKVCSAIGALPLSGGTLTGSLVLKGTTSEDMSYAGNIHPRITFANVDSAQNVSLIFTDYDSYRATAGIKLVGNQGGEWFEAPKFVRTGGTSSQFLKADGSVDSNVYLTSITKAQVEAVLTGNVTSHTHSQYLTSHQSLANYVDKTTDQTIGGSKTFSSPVVCSQSNASSWWLSTAPRGKFIATHGGTTNGWSPVLAFKTYSGKCEFGSLNDEIRLNISLDTRTENGVDYTYLFPRKSGIVAVTSDITSALASYLPLSGGTLTGTLTLNGYPTLVMNSQSQQGWCYQRMKNGSIFWDLATKAVDNGFEIRYNGEDAVRWRFMPNGTLLNNAGNVYWHSGNDGTGSGLDADLLDGVHLTSLFRESVLSAQNLDANNLNTSWVCYTPNGDMNTWGNTTFTNFATTRPEGGFCLLHLKEGNYAKQLYTKYNDNHLYIRNKHYLGSVVWGGWSTVALTSDNVASATKLLNTRTIWGQNFNGEGNVTGTLSNVANIYMSSNLFMSPTGGKGFYLTSNGTDGGFTVCAHENNTWVRTLFHINHAGNVGIGPSLPAHKLDVAGSIIADSWIRTRGATGWYSETYGGGWYMSDTSWIRTYGSKNIYQNAGIMRTDGTLQVGASGATFIATNGGNVGINNTAPAYALDVTGSIRASSEIISTSMNVLRSVYGNYGFILMHDAGNLHFLLTDSGKQYDSNNALAPLRINVQTGKVTMSEGMTVWGNTGLGTDSPSYRLHVSGVIYASTGIFSDGYVSARGQNTSDMRIKNRLEDIELDLDAIVNTPIFNFKFKDTGKWSQGTSAQYMEKILPSTVFDSPECLPDSLERVKSFDYGRAAFIYNVVSTRHFRTVEQELREEIRKLKEEIAELKAR